MIYLLRHGLDDEEFIGGWSDVELTDEGINQVKDTIKFIKDSNLVIKRIISSDIKRALMTASLVGDALNITPICDERLRELDKGLLTGLKKEEADRLYKEYSGDVSVNVRYPEGESLEDLYNRQKETLDWILTLEDTLIVTHRGPINMYYFILTNTPLSNNKKMFGVTHASLHELDKNEAIIKRIYEPKRSK